MNATKSKTIRVKTENVITTKDGRKWEIRKITEKYVLVRMEGFRTSSKISFDIFNDCVNDIDKIN